MNAFAPLLAALAIVQAAPPEAPQPAAAPADAAAPAARQPAAAKEPAAAPVDRVPAPKEPAAAPKEPAAAPAPSPSLATTTARPARSPRPAAQGPPAQGPPAPSPALVPTTAPARRPSPAAAPPPSPPAAAGGDGGKALPRPLPEREDAERTARAFLDALLARDADALAAVSAERFSFDGDARAGREAIRRTWRAILAGREGAPPRLGSVEILASADAVARFGKPPARISPLARPGVLVAVADVGGRTVVLFLAKDGGRMAVLGMHD